MAQPESARKRGSGLRFSLRTLLLVVTLVCIGLWGKLQFDEYRKRQVAWQWVHPLVHGVAQGHYRPGAVGFVPTPTPPAGLKPEQQTEILVIAATRLTDPVARMAGLKILAEMQGSAAERPLWRIVSASHDPEIKAAAIRLLCLSRKPSVLPRLEIYLDDEEPLVRAAAAESLGFIFRPTFEIPIGTEYGFVMSPRLSTIPPIDISGFGTQSTWSTPVEGPASLRGRLEAMMLRGPTTEERTAAARALVSWPPPSYSLRIAEWGVWIDDGGQLKLVQSVLDEIPPFVHQTGNAADSFADRINQIMVITKPIVHLTSDVPLAVDLEVLIRQGRPWYAYPRPDDFAIAASQEYGLPRKTYPQQIESALKRFDRTDLQPLLPLSEGYPWTAPNHRAVGSLSGGMGALGNVASGLGLRWQSLIVSPQRLDWMQPPAVGTNSRYQWWQQLRSVPSSWVASQGETERFLYYDGPSYARSPIAICLSGNQLYLAGQPMFGSPSLPDDPGDVVPARRALVLRVVGNQREALEVVISSTPAESMVVELAEKMPLVGDAVEARFRELLCEQGLTAAEGEGLVASWRKQFFATDGTRVLLFLSRADYDQMCPLTVRPEPTEVARVGLVLTEL